MTDILYSGPAIFQSKNNYNIIVVSDNNKIHAALFETLQHFSLKGKGINLLCAKTLIEAKKIAEKNPELILVIIDENVTMNGSYTSFVDYVRNIQKNQRCCITFKEKLLRTDVVTPINDNQVTNNITSEFIYARDRLIDITRMIMLTHDMEHKIKANTFIDNETIEKSEDGPLKISGNKIYSSIAHDLKEPVANIKVILDFLTNEPDFLDQKTSKELLFRMRESANNVHEMLEDFLFWTRMLKQDIYFNPTKVDLSNAIRTNVILLKSTAASKGISLNSEIAENVFVYADEYMISTVFRNLIYNSIKFSTDNSEITIDANPGSGCIDISLKNSSLSLSFEKLEQLFNKEGVRPINGMMQEAGTSLGLLLCRDFIEKNGGHLELSNRNQSVTKITISLPIWNS